VEQAQQLVDSTLKLPAGYSITWSGQYEYMQRAKARLNYVVPLTLAIIIVLLYLNFHSIMQVSILMCTLPFALIGSIWLMFFLQFNFSIAVGVGMIALAGIAVETGVIMLVYLDQAYKQHVAANGSADDLLQAVLQGAGRRSRPVVMTATATIVGLLPVLLGDGTGSEVMSRLAAPMVGGMISTVILTLLVLPVIYFLWRKSANKT
jgi:Cu(I)/Ag(I) efflux system membrane protein CusA/SilA